MSFFSELRRRNMFRVGVAYLLAAWLLLQVADFVLEVIAAPDWVLQVLVLIAAIGFPAVLVFAWVFELTPEGIRREADIDRSQSITPRTGRKLDRVIIASLVLVVAVLLVDRFLPDDRTPPARGIALESPAGEADTSGIPPGPARTDPAGASAAGAAAEPTRPARGEAPAVAVLPFVNMSADTQNEYFSDGIAEEILNVLARVPDLKVSARTSAFTYKGSDATIAQIAGELGVGHVLEGSVRKAGNRVRVTAQLIEADSGFHLWSDTYDRELTDIFAIQDDIAQSIAGELQVRLLPAADAPNLTGTTDLEAYELYLKGVSLWHLRQGPALERALVLFQQAVERDPDFARGHAYLALTWGILHDYSGRHPRETYPKARAAADRALALDPNSIEAATALIYSTHDITEQMKYARRAIALNPGFATTHQWYGTTLGALGDTAGSEREYRIARELDPRSRVINENLAFLLLYDQRYDEAEHLFQYVLSFAPEFVRANEGLFQIALLRGDRAAAEKRGRELARRLGRTRDATSVYLDLFFDPARRDAAAAEIAGWPLHDLNNPDNPSLIAMWDIPAILAAAGAREEALQALRWQVDNAGMYAVGFTRQARFAIDFVCHEDAQAEFERAGLPPPIGPDLCVSR